MSLVIQKFFGSKKCRRRGPVPGQVLVRMQAIGVNPVETYILAGTCRQAIGIPAYPLSSYRLVGAGLYPAWVASCSVMYLPFLVVP